MAALFTPGSRVLSRALSCVEGAGMSVCVHVRAHAWVCEIEAPGYLGPNAYVGFSMARHAPGHSGSPRHTDTHKHTHTINILLPLWKSKLSAPWQANCVVWLVNPQRCGCQSEPTAVPLVVRIKWMFPTHKREETGEQVERGEGCDSNYMWEHTSDWLWFVPENWRVCVRQRWHFLSPTPSLLFCNHSLPTLAQRCEIDGRRKQTSRQGFKRIFFFLFSM